MGKELACYISDLLVLHVVGDGIVVIVGVNITQLHKVHTNAVISQGLSMHVANSSAHLQEFLILGNGILELAEVVQKHSSAVISSSFISALSSSLAREGQDVIILESLLGSNTVV